ncbi:MAG: restriction endonuclease subunit S [Cellulophaga sp.]|uniref:restriction endonuclease subunit S n=1 Tax=Cellulophaga sp. TaxID=1972202 RepID=UPI00326522D1
MATQKETSLRGTKQSHDANDNNKQIASSLAMTHARVPKLRFKEFEGDWEKKKFGDIAIKVGSGSTPRGGVEVYQNFGIPFIRSQNVVNDRLVLDETCISEEINSKMKGSIVKPKDILLNITGGSIGRSCIVPDDFTIGNVNQHVCIIRLNKNNSPKFIQSFIASYKGQKLITQGQTGSGREGLNFQSIRLFNTHIPNLPEQQKIANFLTAVDTKLQQLTTKKETLAQYKKGVMQQLFSQQLRFKPDGGSAFPDWEEKKLKEFISDFIVPMRDKPKDLKGEIPWCRIEDFDGKYLFKSKSNQGVSIETVKEMNLKVYPINTLLVSCSANLGFCAIVKKELITNQTFIGLVPNPDKIDVDYLFHIMKLSSRRLNVLSSGTTISYLSRKQFENFKINYPSIKEQKKIAAYLSAIDTKIEAVQTQISNTQAFKKGLLQQMFV